MRKGAGHGQHAGAYGSLQEVCKCLPIAKKVNILLATNQAEGRTAA